VMGRSESTTNALGLPMHILALGSDVSSAGQPMLVDVSQGNQC
jgi:hypothetical protein